MQEQNYETNKNYANESITMNSKGRFEGFEASVIYRYNSRRIGINGSDLYKENIGLHRINQLD